MGCGGSTEAEPVEAPEVEVQAEEVGTTKTEAVKISLNVAEADAVKAKPGTETFIASILKARMECAEDTEIMTDCCTRLQAHNRRLKEYIAIYDAQTVDESLNGGEVGDELAKLSQLHRSRRLLAYFRLTQTIWSVLYCHVVSE